MRVLVAHLSTPNTLTLGTRLDWEEAPQHVMFDYNHGSRVNPELSKHENSLSE